MCIICLKPAGVDMPDDETIKYMFKVNPHGAGFALQGDIHGDGRFIVEYHKGFMNVEDLLKALGDKSKLKDLTVAIHCRIKTSGETDAPTTHPFLISNQYADLRKLDGKGAVLFHNGVFSGLGGLINPKSSDTQDFVVGVANKYLAKPKMPKKLSVAIVNEIIGTSRVLILYENRKFPMLRFGSWTEDNGCYYSNAGYKPTVTTTYSGASYNCPYHSHWRSKYSEDYDEWLCNIAEYAWPDDEGGWIRFTEERWESRIKPAMMNIRETCGGNIICNFQSSGDLEWFVDEEFRQIYTSEYEEYVEERRLEELNEIVLLGDSAYMEKGCHIYFDDEETMMAWCEAAKKHGEFKYEYRGKLWYLDTIQLEAFTLEGIKEFFETGQQGHVRHQLETKGFYSDHIYRANLKQTQLIPAETLEEGR